MYSLEKALKASASSMGAHRVGFTVDLGERKDLRTCARALKRLAVEPLVVGLSVCGQAEELRQEPLLAGVVALLSKTFG